MTVHESDVVFNAAKGHTHDGEDSALVAIGEGVIELSNLSSDLVDWILDYISGSSAGSSSGSVSISTDVASPLPDLSFTTGSLEPGESETGSLPWATAALVCSMYVEHSDDTLCDITFYHTDAYTDQVKEFKVVDSTHQFLWEGVWAHTDESSTGKVHYRVKNSGDSSSSFTVKIKSATMVSNRAEDAEPTEPAGPQEIYVPTTTGYDVLLKDIGNIIKCTDTTQQIYMPGNATLAIPVGSRVDVLRLSSSSPVEIVASDVEVELRSATGEFTLREQYSMVSVLKIDTDEWVVIGDLTPGEI